jgi:hypothetical protein
MKTFEFEFRIKADGKEFYRIGGEAEGDDPSLALWAVIEGLARAWAARPDLHATKALDAPKE